MWELTVETLDEKFYVKPDDFYTMIAFMASWNKNGLKHKARWCV